MKEPCPREKKKNEPSKLCAKHQTPAVSPGLGRLPRPLPALLFDLLRKQRLISLQPEWASAFVN